MELRPNATINAFTFGSLDARRRILGGGTE
jgi:hypothetical protein